MIDLLILLIMLFLSAFFSGSETALTSVTMARAESLTKDGRHGAEALLRLKKDPSKMLITILVGNNLVNIGATATATVVATERFGDFGPGIAVGALTLFILVFGEITPKSLATRYAVSISLTVSPILLFLMRLGWPLVLLFGALTNFIHRHSGGKSDPTVTESEIISLLGHGEKEGIIESGEREFIERVFEYGDLRVEDAMTPRSQMVTLNGATLVRDALPDFLAGSYSRVPIYENEPQNLRRIVTHRDMLEAVSSGEQELTLLELGQEPLYVPATLPLAELFTTLRSKQRQIAVVVDEHGEVEGLITVEDLVEELVGEIYDELDHGLTEVKILSETEMLANGDAELRLVEENLKVDLPGKPTDTVSLWILDAIGSIPHSEDSFTIDNLQVTIMRASERQIQQVRLSRKDGAE